ncbi:MAG: hypothetical protein Q8N55_01600 [bacterium]|nr:hypothetical protein [bacterium]
MFTKKLQKKFVKVFFIFFLGFVLMPFFVSAGNYYPAQGADSSGKLTGSAYAVCYDGLVPCGKQVVYKSCGTVSATNNEAAVVAECSKIGKEECAGGSLSKGILHCQICHLFQMINGALNYLFISIIPYVVILMFVIAGIFFYLGGAKPNLKTRAKEVVKTTIIGLVLIYGSFLIVGVALTLLGVTDIEPVKSVWSNNQIFRIDCLIKIPMSIVEP